MKSNLGKTHRMMRIALAATLAALVVLDIVNGTWAIVLVVLAAVMLVTALLNYCPMVTMGICPSVWVGRLFGKKE